MKSMTTSTASRSKTSDTVIGQFSSPTIDDALDPTSQLPGRATRQANSVSDSVETARATD